MPLTEIALKQYIAMIHQSSATAHPTTTIVVKNNIGTVTWERISPGHYKTTTPIATKNIAKTIIRPFGNNVNGAFIQITQDGKYTSYVDTDGKIVIDTWDPTITTPTDLYDIGTDIYIEINIYN